MAKLVSLKEFVFRRNCHRLELVWLINNRSLHLLYLLNKFKGKNCFKLISNLVFFFKI